MSSTHESHPRVSIIILNWNNPQDTIECLRSVYSLDYPNRGVVVVDNASSDDSVEQIRRAFPEVCLVETGRNLGYAGGNNLAIREASARGIGHFLLLNNDTVLAPDALTQIVLAMNEHPEAGMATPLILEYHSPEKIFCLGCAIDRRLDIVRLHAGERLDGQERKVEKVEIATGSALFFDRRVIEKIGLMDEEFFLYYEETDWCLRAGRAGIPIITVPAARIWHKVSAALKKDSPLVTYYMTRNALRFSQRNFPRGEKNRSQVRIGFTAIRSALSDLRDGNSPRAAARMQGIRDYLRGQFGPYESSPG